MSGYNPQSGPPPGQDAKAKLAYLYATGKNPPKKVADTITLIDKLKYKVVDQPVHSVKTTFADVGGFFRKSLITLLVVVVLGLFVFFFLQTFAGKLAAKVT